MKIFKNVIKKIIFAYLIICGILILNDFLMGHIYSYSKSGYTIEYSQDYKNPLKYFDIKNPVIETPVWKIVSCRDTWDPQWVKNSKEK